MDAGIAGAKRRLSELIRAMQSGEAIVITRPR
jgi:antitoxin (DNA-binding transcriptional repressor) of toxin-antitoxin stability system